MTCVVFHVSMLVGIAGALKRFMEMIRPNGRIKRTFSLLVPTVLVIVGTHAAEAWLWAGIYIYLGEFTDISEALYFSVVTSTTLGYGDITLSKEWHLLSSFEAIGGLILFGASTAFMLGVMKPLFEENDN